MFDTHFTRDEILTQDVDRDVNPRFRQKSKIWKLLSKYNLGHFQTFMCHMRVLFVVNTMNYELWWPTQWWKICTCDVRKIIPTRSCWSHLQRNVKETSTNKQEISCRSYIYRISWILPKINASHLPGFVYRCAWIKKHEEKKCYQKSLKEFVKNHIRGRLVSKFTQIRSSHSMLWNYR